LHVFTKVILNTAIAFTVTFCRL